MIVYPLLASVPFNALESNDRWLSYEPAYRQSIVYTIALQLYRPAQLTCRVHNPKHSHSVMVQWLKLALLERSALPTSVRALQLLLFFNLTDGWV